MSNAGESSNDRAGRAPFTPSGTPLLRATNLFKSYRMGPTELKVLQNCTLYVDPGEFVAIMGKSGSGKSTLLHSLGALDVPQKGQVYFHDDEIFAPPTQRRLRTGISDVFSDAERRRNYLRRTAFGFVFQFYHLLPDLNVLENVLLPRMVESPMFDWGRNKSAARQDAFDILQRVGLSERIRHKPNELSGGECQRVAIARALVHRPQILYADEPTGNLDAEAGENIMSILARLHHDGQTIVMVTHDPGIASHADRVLVLENGRLRPA
ncbi:MAG: ABC transporter ATP-binding protein [Phycisphaerae bacterium]